MPEQPLTIKSRKCTKKHIDSTSNVSHLFVLRSHLGLTHARQQFHCFIPNSSISLKTPNLSLCLSPSVFSLSAPRPLPLSSDLPSSFPLYLTLTAPLSVINKFSESLNYKFFFEQRTGIYYHKSSSHAASCFGHTYPFSHFLKQFLEVLFWGLKRCNKKNQ